MTSFKILTYPDRFLRNPVKPVLKIDDRLQEIIECMAQTMYDAPGVGLAAIQAGIDKQIVVFDPEADPVKKQYQVLINPRIIEYHGVTTSENEGCLSVPDFRSDVRRAERIIVEGLDRDGHTLKMEVEEMPAVILQHEIDHLNGILFIDRISPLKRQIYRRKRQKMLKDE